MRRVRREFKDLKKRLDFKRPLKKATKRADRVLKSIRQTPEVVENWHLRLKKAHGLSDRYCTVRLPWLGRTVVANLTTAEYGHAAYEMLFALTIASRLCAKCYVLQPPSPANRALFRLQATRVELIETKPLRALFFKSVYRCVFLFRRFRNAFKNPDRDVRRATLPYFRRRVVEDVGVARLSDFDRRESEALAKRLGIPEDARLVALHVREAGYKHGRNAEDKGSRRFDSTRNAYVESYVPAVDWLVRQGFLVVRLGDRFMTPVHHQGLIDVALSPLRTDALELYLLSRSEFLLGTESGPYHVTYLFGTPALITNATDPIGSYPIRFKDRLVFKRVLDRRTGRFLNIEELLSDLYYESLRDIGRFEYVDNSPEEILVAAREMVSGLTSRTDLAAQQKAFHDMALNAALRLRFRVNYVRKWGSHRNFLGRGRVGEQFLKGYPDGLRSASTTNSKQPSLADPLRHAT